ncbi:MAG: penicillin acylase family protein [Gammaproteobacteria bacterium]|nr:penicillin acylase family protein [Gammaproteobacteria bacterium]MBU2059492.1 penicillin acylase family protein [Gammaproteobacteria bacterium]MBU2176214.1 penicillin acylase family protein [Gammaproteobacteria bacterium]MBU2248147.1 penicillin acylase family protein [Gammaproteobacteria bacterium]MBU2344572.1 penicillin acylase family protein [Gammaproteobacteria bacterium]
MSVLLKKFPLISRAVIFFLLPAAILIIVVYKFYFINALPQNDGVAMVENLKEDVAIQRDINGVVYINASNDEDVYFSMGFVHAQDRLWQLELQRRLSQGRLSEIFGKSAVNQDIWLRTLGIRQAAEASKKHLSKDALKSLSAYAEGVNAWMKSARQLPIEFQLLDIQPEPWTVEDSLSWVKMFALNLSQDFKQEIQAFTAAKYLSATQATVFFPYLKNSEFKDSEVSVEKMDALLGHLLSLQTELENKYKVGGRYVGSNAWVIAGTLTKTGKSVLANDPHLGLQIPSLWYAVSQKGKHLSATGMSLVGLPIIIFGKNNNIAWGGTNMMADVQDLYIEHINPKDQRQYWHNGKWKQFEHRVEVIKVKSDFPAIIRTPTKDIKIQVRNSLNGPIISDVIQGFEQALALKWTALIDDDTSYDAMYQISYAKNWEEFNKALEKQVAPVLNMFYVDDKNNIGMVGAGRIPVRDEGFGNYPVFASSQGGKWSGYVDFNKMPRIYNPENGYIINANNRNTDDSYPYYISNSFAAPYRYDRIERLINERDGGGLSIEDVQRMQADVFDGSVHLLLEHFNKYQPNNESEEYIISQLNGWDGMATTSSVAATLFYSWQRHLKNALFDDELIGFWDKKPHQKHLQAIKELVSADQLADLISSNSVWCDDVESVLLIENCLSVLDSALKNMVEEMTKFAGGDISQWQWGKVQHTVYGHTPFSEMKVLKHVFERQISNGGAVNTINVASSEFSADEGYQQKFGAGFRQIIQFSPENDIHLFMNSTGQSGHVNSSHYDDMIDGFSDVGYIHFSRDPNVLSTIGIAPQSLGNNSGILE